MGVVVAQEGAVGVGGLVVADLRLRRHNRPSRLLRPARRLHHACPLRGGGRGGDGELKINPPTPLQ